MSLVLAVIFVLRVNYARRSGREEEAEEVVVEAIMRSHLLRRPKGNLRREMTETALAICVIVDRQGNNVQVDEDEEEAKK